MDHELNDLAEQILAGGHAATDNDAWRRLIVEPGGAEAWAHAVEREKKAAALALLVVGRPWLARILLAVRRTSRRLAWPEIAPPMASLRTDDLLNANLGPSDGTAEPSHSVFPIWGESVTMAVPLGAEVEVATDDATTVWWMTATGQGMLTSKAWTLESNEAPVTLAMVVGGTDPATDFDTMLQQSVVAIVVLTEADVDSEELED